eukprot:CAMPEP_0174295876 /NCGR_PEP_ID=MMETSP0809-20121228/46131_1 /TAXON_ID=73025 ORGANISM="Eutreptiella gymnastica-like, Strain CCMP1594" /NCGR_SAMPLE_ID=MMETSP0809 /ASSEMBLY_ACC=CAM_ASM_000658 /LENGTH=30 /DNA_ID= /DNA_START= /DNA_END= /DNA_ORIENTATION=
MTEPLSATANGLTSMHSLPEKIAARWVCCA